MFENRYERNIGTLTPEENEKLQTFRVCAVGCGGLGGYVIEELARLGIGHITAVDGDVFQDSNLNRQLFSTEEVLGKSKAETARERIRKVNSEVEIEARHCFLTEENGLEIITEDFDIVVDALDNIPGRRIVEQCCSSRKIPLVHGAIAGWQGQVSVIMPGDGLFNKLYPENAQRGAETETGNPSFTPAVIAGLQVAETVKVLLGKGDTLKSRLLTIDLLMQEYEVIQL